MNFKEETKMKQTKRMLLSLLLAVIIAGGAIVSTHAALAPKLIGDTDGDNYVTITDATKIRRWLAGLTEMDKLAQYLGDVNGDGTCDILDATRIQRKLVNLDSFYKDYIGNWYVSDWRFYADYNSGKAMVGTPVTFTAEVPGYVDHIHTVLDADSQTESPTHTFEFYLMTEEWIDGKYQQKFECIQERSESNTCTYTFTEPGTYKPVCRIYNWLDQSVDATIWYYKVVEPYSLDKPVIVSTLFREDTYSITGESPLTVRAEGGSGDYMYKFTIQTTDHLTGWHIEDSDPKGMITYSYGWTHENVVLMPEPEPDDLWPAWTITIVARDSEGNLSEPVKVDYYRDYRVG